ncbi:Asp23/Gls24 family envelope stress response protein [Gemelliphila palaticanis]|uniref:Asp23/Gls24 family envelope stress response protein n=1 Tax=Gemelliphila palaticanis TaxID=81950 RepID=A0ABX2SZC6_9BACL|nr:Asp23/Gls24 family envelope stress response protein [Gemella palaticanis]MBF0715306.1 Asp23/Gls24 family envelope stress response protein [Gemella palaticanis]NYS47236.1 Asp23/Gls24 family envelope stress response protein [Gemella palaticanis]
MAIEFKNNYGTVNINYDVIASVAGNAAMSCYGIVGMASKNQVRDGLTEILGKENYSKGIVVNKNNDELCIDMYIIVMYGTKISAIASNVQSTVKYQVEKTLGINLTNVNIHIQDIKVVNN